MNYLPGRSLRSGSFILTFLIVFLGGMTATAQQPESPCDPGTLSYSVDLTGEPDGIYESPLDSRTGLCCGADFPDRCVEFFIKLDQNARGLRFDIARGAVPPGSLFYQINCGPIVKVGDPICLEGGRTYVLTFCKPGNNPNSYFIESIPGALVPDTVRTQVNCPVEIAVSGLEASTLRWRDVNSSAAVYNRYLDCTSGCNRVVAIPDEEAERFIRYEVCGTVSAEECPLTYEVCDTVVMEVLPTPRTTFRVDICEGFNYEWRGRTFRREGLYTDTLVSSLGCDSLVSLELKVNPSRRGQLSASICPGENFEIGGSSFSEAGTYEVTLTDSINCDSVITLDLAVLPGPTPRIEGPELLCEGETVTLAVTESFNSYQWSTGATTRSVQVSEPGVYTVTTTSDNGCMTPVSFTLDGAPLLDAAIAGGGTITCADPVVVLQSAVYTDPAGQGVLLEWLDSRKVAIGTQPAVEVRQPGWYFLRISDPSGICSALDSIQIVKSDDVPGFSLSKSGDLDCRTGEVQLAVEADTMQYNIRWTGPGIISGNPNLPVSEPGWYQMEVTDPANGCVSTDSLEVRLYNEKPLIELAGEIQLKCDPGSALLEAQVTGSSLSYSWTTESGNISGNQSSLSVRATSGGWYYFEAIDNSNGCVAADSVLVRPPDQIRAVNLEVVASCSNEPGGSIQVRQFSGGTSPINYSLNGNIENGEGFFSGLSPDSYQLSITDGYGCRWDTTVVIEAIEVNSTTETVELCEGFSYEWNGRFYDQPGIFTDTLTARNGCDSIVTLDLRFNRSNVQVTERVSICPGETYEVGGQSFSRPGTYTIELPGTIACDSIIQLELDYFSTTTPVIEGPPVLCTGDSVELRLNHNYDSYAWSTGSNDPTLKVGTPGAYIVSVTDLNGCAAEARYSIEERSIPRASIRGDSLITCIQSYASLEADSLLLNASLSWFNPQGDLIGRGLRQVVTQEGAYVLQATDETGTCATTDTFMVRISQEVPNLDLSRPESITCQRLEVTLQGRIPGNSNDIEVRWNGPGIISGARTFNPVVNRAGLYRVVATNTVSGCYATATLRVREDRSPPLVGILGDPRLDCISGETSLRASSPDPTVTYQWRTTEGEILTPSGQQDITVSGVGWYNLSVTDAETGCVTDDRVYVDFPDAPRDVRIRSIPTCENVSEGYLIVDRIEGGAPPFRYSLNGAAFDNRGSYTDLSPGTYQLEIVDTEGCSYTDFLEVESLPVPQTIQRVDICEGLSFFWKGQEYTASGMYIDTLAAVNGCDSLDILDLRVNPSVQVERKVRLCEGESFQIGGQSFSEPGNFTLVIPDSVTCDSVIRLEVEILEVDTLVIQGPAEFCEGEEVALEAEGDFISFEWNTGNTGPSQPLRDGGDYSLTATDANGCRRTSTFSIQEKSVPPAMIMGTETVTCRAPSASLMADGIDEPIELNISWFDNNRNLISNDTSLEVEDPGWYYLTVRNALNGCISKDSILIDDGRDVPEITVKQLDTINCIKREINLFAEMQGQPEAVIVTWSGPGILAGANALTPRVESPGLYRIEVENTANGCIATDSVRVQDDRRRPPLVLAEEVGLDCQTQVAMLDAVVDEGNYAYQWSTTTGKIDGEDGGASLIVETPGLYIVEVTDLQNGCSAQDSVTVFASEGPQGADVDVNPSCAETKTGSLIIDQVRGGTAPFVFFLDGRPYSDLDTFRNMESGSYELAIEDAAGCRWDSLLTIPALPPLNVELDIDLEIELGDSVYLLPSVNISRAEMAEIIWTPSEGLSCVECLDPMATPDASTEYRLEIVDINGCRGSDVARIAVDGRPPVYIPNVFSPNGDGVNDRFTIFGDSRITQVKELRIFSRWGEMVYHRENFPPNEPAFGWDGTLDRQVMNAAVFVYYTIVELSGGKEVILKGDITLMR